MLDTYPFFRPIEVYGGQLVVTCVSFSWYTYNGETKKTMIGNRLISREWKGGILLQSGAITVAVTVAAVTVTTTSIATTVIFPCHLQFAQCQL